MRCIAICLLLLSGFNSFGQFYNDSPPDTTEYKQTVSGLVRELNEKSQPLLQRIDSMEQVIKTVPGKDLKQRLETIMGLVKNNTVGDVYNKIQEFGVKLALEINEKIAPPNFFYRLDREYYNYTSRLDYLGKTVVKAKKDAEDAADCREKEIFPYDSLLRAMGPIGDSAEKRQLFLTTLGKLYQQPVTEEDVDCDRYTFHRIIICGEQTEVFIRKQWKWGGIFCFYNDNIALKEADYIDYSKSKMEKALNYRKAREK